jgi:uncharacterized repeat protein (TIGR03803 family)
MNTQPKINKSETAVSRLLQVARAKVTKITIDAQNQWRARLFSRPAYFLFVIASLLFVYQPAALGFITLYGFTRGSDGGSPSGDLVLSGSTLYGTTFSDGAGGYGTIYKIGTSGSGFTVLHSFTGSDGKWPAAGLALSGTTLYGTGDYGGSSDYGTVFKINTDGSGFTVLHNFGGSDGRTTQSPVIVQGSTLYGVTVWGGAYDRGVVFKLNTDGSGYTVLHSFDGTDGALPFTTLVLSGSTLYGTSSGFLYGTVFKVNTDGTGFAVLHTFNSSEGYSTDVGLTLSGNTLYGATRGDWNTAYGTVFKLNTDGSSYTTLHTFTGGDGEGPYGRLVLSGSTLYGTTVYGGCYADGGTVFAINTDGTGFTTLWAFQHGSDGSQPNGGLLLSGGTLYGTAMGDGPGGSPGFEGGGTVFSLSAIPVFIDIDFDAGSGPSAKSGFAATGKTANDFWNFYTRDDGNGGWKTSGYLANLSNVDTSSSGVGLTINNAPGAWNNGSSDHMYGGYIYPFSGNATFTLTNLPPGNYNIYLYSVDGNYDLSVGGSYIGNRTTSDWPLHSDPPVWQSGVQYGLFSNVAVTCGQSVVVTVKPGTAGWAILSGMQIEPVQP